MDIKSSTIWNILTVLVLLATGVVIFVYGIIFLFPNNPMNFLAPQAPPAVVVLPSATATLAKLPPTNTVEPEFIETATLWVTDTVTPTITSTMPTATASSTATITNTPTITGTPATVTPTATFTVAAAVKTSWAQTRVAQTQAAEKTQAAQQLTSAASQKTQSVQRTANAAATQTQSAGNATATQETIATATAIVITETAQVYDTATAVAATATQEIVHTEQAATVTEVAQQTRTQQAEIEDNNPIAYSITGGNDDAEWFVTKKPSSGSGGSVFYNLDLSLTVFDGARPVSSWWLGDTDNHYLLFSDPDILNPIHRLLYTTTTTNEQIDTDISGQVLQPSVDLQSGTADSRTVVFSYALAPGEDRNLWVVQGDGGFVNQISSDDTRDDHDPDWVVSGNGTYNGQVIYVSGRATGAENIYIMQPSESYYPGTQLTFYDVATTEINSPRWCYGYDWEAEEYYDSVVFAMRTSGSDDWDLYQITPSVQTTNGDNEDIVFLTTTDGDENETQPDWSPFCNRITYLYDNGTQTDVWTMNADGTNRAKLTDTGEIEAQPLWMPYKDGMVLP